MKKRQLAMFRIESLDDLFKTWVMKQSSSKMLSKKIINAIKVVYGSEIYHDNNGGN